MPTLEHPTSERSKALALAATAAVSIALGVALNGSGGLLGVIGTIFRVIFMVALVWLAVLGFKALHETRLGVLGAFLVLGVVVLIGGGIVGLLEMEHASESEKAALEKLEPLAAEYLAASGRRVDGRPRVAGRMVTVDLGKREIDEGVYIRLPAALQARSPKEVRTVVQVRYRDEVVGEYQDGAKALQEKAYITIVDLRTHREYEGRTIEGLEPAYVKRGGGDQTGGPLDKDDIANYLKRLVRTEPAGRNQ
jgi:hypothetical protein